MKTRKTLLIYPLLVAAIIASSCTEKTDVPDPDPVPPVRIPEKAYVLAEQTDTAVVILNAETNVEVWKWTPATAGLPKEQREWFVNPSEVKPVYNGRYVLMTASGGAVALIRISDSKLMFYAKCGDFPNPHSAEILPDGNIVTAESRYGDICLFVTDTVKVLGEPIRVTSLGNAHNAVWDREHECLFMTGNDPDVTGPNRTAIFRFHYNGDRENPALTGMKKIYTFENESGGHDLFPVYGEDDMLWLSAASAVYRIDVSDPDAPVCEKAYNVSNIKSVSNGPDGVIMLKPTEEWWAEGLVDETAAPLFLLPGTKIYKGRWWLDNTFSYPEVHEFKY